MGALPPLARGAAASFPLLPLVASKSTVPELVPEFPLADGMAVLAGCHCPPTNASSTTLQCSATHMHSTACNTFDVQMHRSLGQPPANEGFGISPEIVSADGIRLGVLDVTHGQRPQKDKDQYDTVIRGSYVEMVGRQCRNAAAGRRWQPDTCWLSARAWIIA